MSQTLLSILAFVPLVLAGVLLIGFRWPAKYAMPLVFVLTALIDPPDPELFPPER